MSPHPRPDAGLKPGERDAFWRLRNACGDGHMVDVDEHIRCVVKTLVSLERTPLRRRVA